MTKTNVLCINAGSSSIKFAVYQTGDGFACELLGKLDRIGLAGSQLSFSDLSRGQEGSCPLEAGDFASAASFLLDWLEQQSGFTHIAGVGHRLVHGMQHTQPEIVSAPLLEELQRICAFSPDHLPNEIALIELIQQRYPELPQVACFDTAFHRTLPRVARLLPLPRRFDSIGIQRYGFHGLSYAYLMQKLAQLDPEAGDGRVILAHLGNGASLAAVRAGRSLDTSMGFTPAGGITMGTRPGDLDPGVAWYMLQHENLTAQQFNRLINHESGLLGVSETSSDMRDLLQHEASDTRAQEAVELFCYQVKKCIGAYAAVLNGLDTLVFAGGIGESAAAVRARICDGLGFLGIAIQTQANTANAEVISTPSSRVTVRVMHTDEELMIAKSASQILGFSNEKDKHEHEHSNH